MSTLTHLARLVVRQDPGEGETSPPTCGTGNEFDGRLGLRISAIFVILVGSTLGAVFPVFARRHRGLGVPDWAFFVAKYFGSGVIIATAFIHVSETSPITSPPSWSTNIFGSSSPLPMNPWDMSA